MRRQDKRVRKYIMDKFIGTYKYVTDNKDKFVKCEDNDPEKDFSILDVEVDYSKVIVTFKHHDPTDGAVGWIHENIIKLINYGHSFFTVRLEEITKGHEIKKSLVREFVGNGRYRNLDYRIIKLGFQYQAKKPRWMSYRYNDDDRGKEMVVMNVCFSMDKFRGDRTFMFTHIQESIVNFINKKYPGISSVNVNVRMIKP
jgi:hypothetical protein